MTDYRIEAKPGEARAEGCQAALWLTSNFASSWYNDAVEQARLTGRDALRREIIFAVCAVESYLLEWVRDEVFGGNYDELQKFVLSIGKKQGIRERWKTFLRELSACGKIATQSRNVAWQDFCTLVDFRDGLVHGKASLPYTSGRSKKLGPVPSHEEFQQTAAGWAVKVVNALLQDLHKTVATDPPNWLITL